LYSFYNQSSFPSLEQKEQKQLPKKNQKMWNSSKNDYWWIGFIFEVIGMVLALLFAIALARSYKERLNCKRIELTQN
jgi:hypothetical protein